MLVFNIFGQEPPDEDGIREIIDMEMQFLYWFIQEKQQAHI